MSTYSRTQLTHTSVPHTCNFDGLISRNLEVRTASTGSVLLEGHGDRGIITRALCRESRAKICLVLFDGTHG